MSDYTPIACATHDQLEHFAIRRTLVRIRYREGDRMESAEGRIADILASEGAEFIVLEGSGQRIRLDRINDIGPAD